ncbi:MAG: hypothetical protein RMJ87_09650 [Cytophagales bacterium]|nr:hypothetical protein [Bernardetiaceae bacterium]MDW8205281.1 hypothetical protein [Cytophagales bacterium]
MKYFFLCPTALLLGLICLATYAQTDVNRLDSLRKASEADSIRKIGQEPFFKNSSIDMKRGKSGSRVGSDHVAKIGFGALIGMPVAEFQQVAGDVIPWGYGINAVFRLTGRSSPFFAGFDFGYMGMGRTVDAFTGFAGSTNRVIRRNRIITGHVLVRFQPIIGGPIRPYLDGMLGLKYFRTATEIENNFRNTWSNSNTNRNAVTVPNHEDLALSYGGGIGINIVLGNNVWLDLRSVYLPGTVASYVKRGDVYPDPNDPNRTIVVKSRSATHMLNHQVGITFSF